MEFIGTALWDLRSRNLAIQNRFFPCQERVTLYITLEILSELLPRHPLGLSRLILSSPLLAPDRSGHCRTSTASRSQGLNRELQISVRCQSICQKECQIAWQIIYIYAMYTSKWYVRNNGRILIFSLSLSLQTSPPVFHPSSASFCHHLWPSHHSPSSVSF